MEKIFELAVGVFCRLQTFTSVVSIVVIGLVLGQSLMVISTIAIPLYVKVSILYNVSQECLCCYLHINYFFTIGYCTLGHQTIPICKVSDLYLLCF